MTAWRSRTSPTSPCFSCAAKAASATIRRNRSPKPMRRSARGSFCASSRTLSYPRDLAGYGAKPPKAKWPGGARLALQFVLNYEEGGENSVLHGDKASESFLSEIVGAQPLAGVRHMSMESLYEYGSPRGGLRPLQVLQRHDAALPLLRR